MDETGIELAPHQILAYEWLENGNILCGGVGSGKSRTSLAYYYINVCGGEIPINGEGWYSPRTNPLKLYIITTARKRDTGEWAKEILPFGYRDEIDYVVDSWNNIEKYRDISDAFFIFDEQRVVGYGTWAKTFIHIAKQNRWIILTATPGDTWSDYIPIFVANGFYKNKSDFATQHIVYSRYAKYPKIEYYINVEKLIYLRDSIMIRMDYSKNTVMHEKTVHVDYDEETYKDCLKRRWDIFTRSPCMDVNELCRVLREIVNRSVSRMEALRFLINEHPKIIVFYNFNYELECIRDICIQEKVTYAEWNGHKHEPIPSDYNHWVYIVQYTAGAEGWNCIETNVIVFYSLSYSYKAMVQAAGRIDRMNTPFHDLYTYKLVSGSSIERSIQRCLDNKKDFNAGIFMSEKTFKRGL